MRTSVSEKASNGASRIFFGMENHKADHPCKESHGLCDDVARLVLHRAEGVEEFPEEPLIDAAGDFPSSARNPAMAAPPV